MSLTMLVEDEGRNYTAAEYEHWLTQTGFQRVRRIPSMSPAPTVHHSRETVSPGHTHPRPGAAR
jgi:hypothetical protein